jgi:hypothetical protein
MPEEHPSPRKACLEDFLCDTDIERKHEKQQKGRNDEKIQKNQKEYGQRKRIKP